MRLAMSASGTTCSNVRGVRLKGSVVAFNKCLSIVDLHMTPQYQGCMSINVSRPIYTRRSSQQTTSRDIW